MSISRLKTDLQIRPGLLEHGESPSLPRSRTGCGSAGPCGERTGRVTAVMRPCRSGCGSAGAGPRPRGRWLEAVESC